MTRFFVLVPLALLVGCATPMLVSTTPPGADITVDGKSAGKSPATVQVDSGGGPLSVRAKGGGKDVTKSVPKDQTNWGPVAGGAGVGVGACCAINGAAGLISLIFPPAAFLGCVGCVALVGAPAGAYFLWGSKPADQVSLEMGVPASAIAPAAPQPVAPSTDAPPAPPAPLAPQPY